MAFTEQGNTQHSNGHEKGGAHDAWTDDIGAGMGARYHDLSLYQFTEHDRERHADKATRTR